ANAHPIQLPIGAEDQFRGIIDLVEMNATFYGNDLGTDIEIGEIPEEYQDQANEYREKLVEAVAELDEDLMERYLGGEEISNEELRAAIRTATLKVEFYQVTSGTACKNNSIQIELDEVIDYLPATTDVAAIQGRLPDTDHAVDLHSDDSEPFSALAFQVLTDTYVGTLSISRVYSLISHSV